MLIKIEHELIKIEHELIKIEHEAEGRVLNETGNMCGQIWCYTKSHTLIVLLLCACTNHHECNNSDVTSTWCSAYVCITNWLCNKSFVTLWTLKCNIWIGKPVIPLHYGVEYITIKVVFDVSGLAAHIFCPTFILAHLNLADNHHFIKFANIRLTPFLGLLFLTFPILHCDQLCIRLTLGFLTHA